MEGEIRKGQKKEDVYVLMNILCERNSKVLGNDTTGIEGRGAEVLHLDLQCVKKN